MRTYGFAPQTAVSVGAQERAGEVRVISMMVCRDADKPKADRHWEDAVRFDLP